MSFHSFRYASRSRQRVPEGFGLPSTAKIQHANLAEAADAFRVQKLLVAEARTATNFEGNMKSAAVDRSAFQTGVGDKFDPSS